MDETSYGIDEGPAARVGKRELRGRILDEYLADYEHRNGPNSEQEQERARRVFDEVFAEEGQRPAAG